MNISKKLVNTKEDKEILDSLIKEIWPNVYREIIGQAQVDYMLATFQSLAKIETEIEQGLRYFLIYLGDQAVGYTAYAETETEVYLSKLYLTDSARGQGISRQLFTWYDELARGKIIRLTVNKYNQQGIDVYEHCGFQRVASQITEIGEGYVMDDYLYERDLRY